LDLKTAAASWSTPIRTFEPCEENTERYEASFEVYKEIYRSLANARRMLQRTAG
jgi:hypothetical protein